MEPELWVVARREHDVEQARPPGKQHLELRLRVRRGELLQVVDHEHDLLVQGAELCQQAFDHCGAVERRRRRKRLHERIRADGCPQLLDHRQPEALRVQLAALLRHPRGPIADTRLIEPRTEHDGLPAAGRRRDKRHAAPSTGREPLEQGFPGDHRRRPSCGSHGNLGCGTRAHQALLPSGILSTTWRCGCRRLEQSFDGEDDGSSRCGRPCAHG
jgi:hypothetical protein